MIFLLPEFIRAAGTSKTTGVDPFASAFPFLLAPLTALLTVAARLLVSLLTQAQLRSIVTSWKQNLAITRFDVEGQNAIKQIVAKNGERVVPEIQALFSRNSEASLAMPGFVLTALPAVVAWKLESDWTVVTVVIALVLGFFTAYFLTSAERYQKVWRLPFGGPVTAVLIVLNLMFGIGTYVWDVFHP